MVQLIEESKLMILHINYSKSSYFQDDLGPTIR